MKTQGAPMHETKNCFSVVVPDEAPKLDQELQNCQEKKATGSERKKVRRPKAFKSDAWYNKAASSIMIGAKS
jgi:hypothetical protein